MQSVIPFSLKWKALLFDTSDFDDQNAFVLFSFTKNSWMQTATLIYQSIIILKVNLKLATNIRSKLEGLQINAQSSALMKRLHRKDPAIANGEILYGTACEVHNVNSKLWYKNKRSEQRK